MKRLLPVCVMILCLICSGFTAAETEKIIGDGSI